MDFRKYVTGNTFSTLECSSMIDIKELVSFLQSNEHITELHLSSRNIDDEGAKQLVKLSNLTSLYLSRNNIGNVGAKQLAKLSNLTSLDLSCNKIGDEGAKQLAKLSNLTSLDLLSNSISDEGAKQLAKLINLTSLDLSCNKIGDEGAKQLANLSNLTSLDLLSNNISDEGAKQLAKLINLTSLDLKLNKIGSEGAKQLANLSNLTSLNLSCNKIGDEGATELAKLTNLTSLDLSGNNISDEGVKALTKPSFLKNLKKLVLGKIEIGVEGIESLAEIKNFGVKLIHSLEEESHKIFYDFLLKPRSHNQVTYKKDVKNMIFNVAQHDNSGKIVKHILTQPNKYHFLINSQNKEGHTLSHFYTHSSEMQEFLFQLGLIPEKEPERDAELQGISQDGQSVHTGVANKEKNFITTKLVESIKASKDELKQAATSYMENLPKLLKQYQNNPIRLRLLSLTDNEKRSVMKETLHYNAPIPDDKKFIEITFEKVKKVLETKYLIKDQEGKYIGQFSLPESVNGDTRKITIPESIGYIKLLINQTSIPLQERKELLVALAEQNPGLVQEKLPKIRSKLEDYTFSQEQITNRTKFYKLLNNVDDSKVDGLFKEISGLDIEEIWREQKEFVLLKQIYVAATTYGENSNACIQGTWSQIISSVSEISTEIIDQFQQHLKKEREQEKQRNSITEENITEFVENLAGELIQYVEGNTELKDTLLDFAVASTNINEPKEITFEEQKIFAMISQKLCKDIKKYLPNYDRNIPKQDEYKIIINKLPEVGIMQNFALDINKKQGSIASLDDIGNPTQEKNDGLSNDTQTKSKSTSSKACAIGIGCGMVIGAAIACLAGATTLTPAIAAIVFFAAAVVGALAGCGIVEFCKDVSEEKQNDPDVSTWAAVKTVLFGVSTTKYSESQSRRGSFVE